MHVREESSQTDLELEPETSNRAKTVQIPHICGPQTFPCRPQRATLRPKNSENSENSEKSSPEDLRAANMSLQTAKKQ
jgi:hypothetical protein